jgi:hypothetical protein
MPGMLARISASSWAHELASMSRSISATFSFRAWTSWASVRPNELGDQSLARNGGVLPLGGLHDLPRQPLRTAHAASTQPTGKPRDSETPKGCRGLVADQQDERPVAGQDKRPFESRKHAGQSRAQPVDGPGAVADEIGAAVRQEPELDDGVVAGPYRVQVAADAGLVSDDERVAGVGLALTAVAVTGPVNYAAGNVEDFLPVVDQQGE